MIPKSVVGILAVILPAITADAVSVSMNIDPTNNKLQVQAGVLGIADTCQNPPSTLRNLYFDANLDGQVLLGERIGTGNDAASFTYDSKNDFGSWFNLIDPGNEGNFWWIVTSADSPELEDAIGGTPSVFAFDPFHVQIDGIPTLISNLTTASPVDVGSIRISATVRAASEFDTVGIAGYGSDGARDACVDLKFLQTNRVPEPGTVGLMALALGFAALRRRILS